MRRLTCRFADAAAFLENFDPAGDSTLAFTVDDAIDLEGVVHVTIVVQAHDERHSLHMRLTDRRPTVEAHHSGVSWRYTAAPTCGDRPWLEMLAEKLALTRCIPTASGDVA